MMNTQVNTIPGAADESFGGSGTNTPSVIPQSRLLYWSIRREVWENRSLYLAPLAVAALFLFGFLISTFHLPEKMRDASALDPMQQQELIQQPYNFAALLLMFVTVIVGVVYCLDALYSERRERSILFWKSLPVSDLTTVLSKASIPLVVLPLLTFAITLATQWIMLLLSTAVLLADGRSVAPLWTDSWIPASLMLLYHLLAVHALWWAPLWGWLLLVSAWARRAPFLWATLPLLVIGFVEKIAFNTWHFAGFIKYRFLGGSGNTPSTGNPMSMNALTPTPIQFVTSASFWLGLAVCAVFLAAAVRLRHSREAI